jgi:hypothetical protein
MWIFEKLSENLLPSSRKERVKPDRLVIDDDECVSCYDLTSFTSSLWEHSAFLHALADYCQGHEVKVLDGFDGFVYRDLGQMIRTYADQCYDNMQFFDPTTGKDCQVSNGGLMGVIGNIDSARFLHAAVMLQISHPSKLNVAGDDVAIIHHFDWAYIRRVTGLLGTVNEKTFHSEEGRMVHLKKPWFQLGTSMVSLPSFHWPCFEYLPEVEDTRWPLPNDFDRQVAMASSILNFLQEIEGYAFSEDMRDFTYQQLLLMYTSCGLPKNGYVPQLDGHAFRTLIPVLDEALIGKDPIASTIDIRWRYYSYLTVRKLESVKFLGAPGFSGNSNSVIAYLKKLGYVSASPQKQMIIGLASYQGIFDEFFMKRTLPQDRGNRQKVYDFVVCESLPHWCALVC